MVNQNTTPSRLAVVLAYVIGVGYWLAYLLKGKPTFTSNDWMKEQVFTNLVRDSLQTWSLPWRMSIDFYHAGVYELVANPEISLSPDFLLLPFLSNNTYFLVHWLLFFTLGFIGTVLLARKYQLSSLSFLFVVVLFNCNGFIGAHLSEGHIQWAGYFLYPFFFYWLSDLAADVWQDRTRTALKLSLLLGFMFLNGSFHMAIWCLMFLALTLLYRQDLARWVGLVILLVALMAMARLLPAGLCFPPKTDFVSGYPSISTLLDAFTFIYHPENPARGGGFGNLMWHEYSFYIGYIGLVFLTAGAYHYVKLKLQIVPAWWIPAALIMFMFAMGDVYQLIPNSGIPFSTIERVASRFIVIPFCVLLIIAAVGCSHLQQRHRQQTNLVLGVALVPMMGEIFQNARKWRLQSYEMAVGTHDIPAVTLVPSTDQFLPLIIAASWTVSALVALFVFIRLARVSKDAK